MTYDPFKPLLDFFGGMIAEELKPRRQIDVKYDPELNAFPLVYVDVIGSYRVKVF